MRLWNYAAGSPTDAVVTIDFAALDGGFLLPGEADPVWAGNVDRLFISLVAPAYDGSNGALPAPAEGWAEMSGIACDGPGSMLAIGDAQVPAHGLRIATGYDDLYDVTPARMLRNVMQLGYRGIINHYVGMSHYFRLAGDPLTVTLAGGALNAPCRAWHADFAGRAKALGYDVILSLSYELFDAHAPAEWKQRAENGDRALTGWVPPSTLLSPANDDAMAYLQAVARAFVHIADEAGLAVRFQIGEPWWWVMPQDGRPCLYDAAAVEAYGRAPPSIPTMRSTIMSAAQKAYLDAAGALLAASTLALRDAVRDEVAGAEVLLLVYLPTVLDAAAPEAKRANVPIGWAQPAFDTLQLEDYDWVAAGDRGSTARGVTVATARLGYPVDRQHYFAGFVLRPEDAAHWQAIDAAAETGRARGTAETFIWALPQVVRDGFVHFDIGQGDSDVQAFDDVPFPIALGREASVEPAFSTAIVTTASGQEQRNSDWADARLRFDAGPGVRSETDVQTLIAFFRARRGAARGFRFRDPFDHGSSTGEPGFVDQPIGTGDGTTTRFPLVKLYGDDDPQRRRITRPLAGSVRVGVGGIERNAGWSLEEGGIVAFDTAPAVGVAVTAGYLFDVPVRFAEDRLEVSRATFGAGAAASVPLVELREAVA